MLNKNNKFGKLESDQLNRDTYWLYFSQLKNMAITLFEWEGLPKTVNERFLEEVLFEYGHAVFVNDPIHGFLGLTGNLQGFNMYQEPTSIHAYATGYDNDFTPNKDSVVIYNNAMKEPNELLARSYAKRLYEVERTIDVNIKAQKTPVLVLADETQRMTLKNLYMQYDGNEPFIFGNKSLDTSTFQVLKTDAPFVADKLIQYKHSLWNECMTKLGLSNTNTDKKERLVEAEATSNDEQIESCRNVMLVQRQIAAKKINELFNLNITVKFRNEVTANGEVHDPNKDDSRE